METSLISETLPPGWLSDQEAEYLAEQARDKLVLEIGAFLGRSTVAMARTATHVVSIDHHHGRPEPTVRDYLANLESFGVSDKVTPIVADFGQAVAFLRSTFGMAFVDAGHDGISVLRDGRAAYLLLRIGAPLVFHDYGVWVGVTSGVHELAKRWEQTVELVPETSLAVLYRR
jgi:Methyltransferase domain